MTRFLGVVVGACLVLCSCSGLEALDRAVEGWWRVQYDYERFDVEHYSIALDIDPARRTITGACTIRVWLPRVVWAEDFERRPELEAAAAEPLAELNLDFDGLAVDSITDVEGRALAWSHEQDRLVVTLAEPLQLGDFTELTVRYSGSPRAGLWFAGERDGVPTQVFTHGQCTEARAWFPSHDRPSDRATSELRVTMPVAWSAIAAGERIERVEYGDRATELWRTSFPHPSYLETLVAGELALEHGAWDGVPLVFACAPERSQYLGETFAETGEILTYFSGLTGVRYPYAKYAQACVDNFPFGGMENISATTLTDSILPDDQDISDSARELIAHEAAHQWFGNLVTCGNWNDAWLNEGFATYFAALYEEHALGPDAFQARMRDVRDKYLSRDVGANRRPIAPGGYDQSLAGFFTGHVYEGGATRLHYLRGLLGDEMFFAGVRRYLSLNRGGSVSTEHLRVAFEEVSGRDLERFFNAWVNCAGHPEVKSSWTYRESGKRIELTLEQTAGARDFTPTTFDFELDVEIATEHGTRVQRVHLDRRRAVFELTCDGEPAWVRVDPRDFVPMKLDEHMPAKAWIELAKRGDTSGRLRAIDVLARSRRSGLKPNELDRIEALLLEFAAGDENADVRRAAVEALGRALSVSRRAAARELFFYAARNDVSRDVKLAALRALRSCGRDAEVNKLAVAALARPQGWDMRGEIVGLIATSAPDAAFEYLERALETRSAHGTFEARVLAELLSTKHPRARGVLLAWMRDETKPDAARAVALRELTRSRLQGAELEAVIDLLASPRIRMRREAIVALGTSSDTRARTALERHIASRPSAIELISADQALERLPDEP